MMPAIEILRRRWTLIAVVRLVSLLIASIAIFPVLAWIAEGTMDDDLLDFYYYWPQLTFSIGLIAIGVLGFVLAPPIVRLSTPVRSQVRCPKCQYELLAPAEPLCPECGLDVTSLWEPVAPSTALSDAAWRARVTANIAGVLRLIGFVVGLYTTLYFLWVVTWVSIYFEDDPVSSLLMFVWPILFAAGSVALIFLGSWLAGRIVPTKPGPPASQRPAGGDHDPGEPCDEHPDKH